MVGLGALARALCLNAHSGAGSGCQGRVTNVTPVLPRGAPVPARVCVWDRDRRRTATARRTHRPRGKGARLSSRLEERLSDRPEFQFCPLLGGMWGVGTRSPPQTVPAALGFTRQQTARRGLRTKAGARAPPAKPGAGETVLALPTLPPPPPASPNFAYNCACGFGHGTFLLT